MINYFELDMKKPRNYLVADYLSSFVNIID